MSLGNEWDSGQTSPFKSQHFCHIEKLVGANSVPNDQTGTFLDEEKLCYASLDWTRPCSYGRDNRN
jgi:hypothetical protein